MRHVSVVAQTRRRHPGSSRRQRSQTSAHAWYGFSTKCGWSGGSGTLVRMLKSHRLVEVSGDLGGRPRARAYQPRRLGTRLRRGAPAPSPVVQQCAAVPPARSARVGRAHRPGPRRRAAANWWAAPPRANDVCHMTASCRSQSHRSRPSGGVLETFHFSAEFAGADAKGDQRSHAAAVRSPT